MKKKFFAVALATTMAVSSVLTANAAELSGAWWTAWTEAYELADGKTLEFDIDVKGGDSVWNNVAAVFTNSKTTGTQAPADEAGASYKEYAVIRGDNWGWGGGDNKSVDGSDITYEGGIASMEGAEQTDKDAAFIAAMKDAHLDVKITRSGNDVTYVYDMTSANGAKATRTAKFTSDMSAGAYVFFVPDTATISVAAATGETNTSETPTSGDNTEKKDNASAATTAPPAANNNGGKNSNTNNNTATKTGDVAPITALAAVAVVACAAVVVSRKKVTE